MTALTDLKNRYHEGDKMTNLEILVITAEDEKAAKELATLKALSRANVEKVEELIREWLGL